MPYAIEIKLVADGSWQPLSDFGLMAGSARRNFEALCEMENPLQVKYRLVRYTKEVLAISDGPV